MELNCPAGTPAAFRAAVDAGADSVYCGFRLRAPARKVSQDPGGSSWLSSLSQKTSDLVSRLRRILSAAALDCACQLASEGALDRFTALEKQQKMRKALATLFDEISAAAIEAAKAFRSIASLARPRVAASASSAGDRDS
jgi:hypothetical protein